MEEGKSNPGVTYKLVISNTKANSYHVAKVPDLKVTAPQSVNLKDVSKSSEANPSGTKKVRKRSSNRC